MYNKHTWLARIGTGLNKFTNSGNAQNLVLTPNPDSVSQAGTPFSAAWMNEMEDGIHTANKFLGAIVEEATAGSAITANDIIYVNLGVAEKAGKLIAVGNSDYGFSNSNMQKVCLTALESSTSLVRMLVSCGNNIRLVDARRPVNSEHWPPFLSPSSTIYNDTAITEIVDSCLIDGSSSYYFAACYMQQTNNTTTLGIGLYKADYNNNYSIQPVCRISISGEIPTSEYTNVRNMTKLIRTYKSGNTVYVTLIRRNPRNGTPTAESFSFDISNGTGTSYGATEISSDIATAVTGFGVGLNSAASLQDVSLRAIYTNSSYLYMKTLSYNTSDHTLEVYDDSDVNKVGIGSHVTRLLFTPILSLSGDDGVIAAVNNQGATNCFVISSSYGSIRAAEANSRYEINISNVTSIAYADKIYVVGDTDVAVYDSYFDLMKIETGMFNSMNGIRAVLPDYDAIVCQTEYGKLQILAEAKPWAIAANSAQEGETVFAVYEGNIYGTYSKGQIIRAVGGVSSEAHAPGCLTVSGYWRNQS